MKAFFSALSTLLFGIAVGTIMCLQCGAAPLPIGFWQKGGAAPFNPQTQGTLVNWYDASTLGLANLANVNPFTDSKTGNPNPLSAGNPYPTYATNQQNGLGAVLFSTAFLTTGGSDSSTYPYTIAVVVKITSFATEQALMGSSGSKGIMIGIQSSTGHLEWVSSQTSLIGASTSAIPTGSYHLVTGTVTSSAWALYLDGSLVGSGSNSTVLTAGSTFVMGATSGSTSQMTGNIAEVQIYNSVLSSGDLAGLHTYIATKWATP